MHHPFRAASTFDPLLHHFANREEEQLAFRRLVDLPADQPLPLLLFHGGAGVGKSWLLHKLRAELPPGLPSALLDFDAEPAGSLVPRDLARALARLREQFAPTDFPRFDLAFSFLCFRQSVKDEALLKTEGLAEASFTALTQLASAEEGAYYEPEEFVQRVAANVGKAFAGSRLERWLNEEAARQDVRRLRRMSPEEINSELVGRFLHDLADGLHERSERACRGVIFLDAVESLQTGPAGAHFHLPEHWLHELHQTRSGILVVLASRGRLPLEEGEAGAFDHPPEQHLLGGLSELDARALLAQAGAAHSALLDRVMLASLDGEPGGTGMTGYHPFSLGLGADLVSALADAAPSAVELPSTGLVSVARSFLQAVGSSAEQIWLRRLAATPRFDEFAARAAFPAAEVRPEAVWGKVGNYRFVCDAGESWRAFHPCMRRALLAIEPDCCAEDQRFWRDYWRQRSHSDTDVCAALAWHHHHALEPGAADGEWKALVASCRQNGRMADHYRLLGWWDSIDLEARSAALPRNPDSLMVTALGTSQAAGAENPAFARADALVELGREYYGATFGLRSENVRRSIGCYEAALQVYTEEDHLPQWAALQNHLGMAYEGLKAGNRADNLRKAIACYTSALRVFTEASQPALWAATLNNLGTAFGDLPSGDRGENLHCAIECHESALRVYTEAEHPVKWADTLTNLGAAYAELPSGDRGENLRRAIDCYESALRVHNQSRDLTSWAATQNNLGVAYNKLPSGDREANVRRAIICFQAALGVHTEAEHPGQWATLQNNLGSALEQLQSDDWEENLCQAITCYMAALRVYTEAEHPAHWATLQSNLGAAYTELASVADPENLEKAIACYEAALRVRTESDYPPQWAFTQNNLGLAYEELPTGSRRENLGRTISYYEAALRVLTEADYPADWSMTQDNLGTALEELAVLTKDDRLSQRAVACFEAAERGYRGCGFTADADALHDRVRDARKRFS